MILALILLAQVLVGPQYYVLDYPPDPSQMLLVTDNGRYPIDLGMGCDGIQPGNVEFLAGSGGVGAIRAPGSNTLCNVYLEQQVSPVPCLQTDGVCDVANEYP